MHPIKSKSHSNYRQKALQLKGPYCHICASVEGLEVHHIDGSSLLAGTGHIHGLIPLCGTCHAKITSRSEEFPYSRWSELATQQRFPHGSCSDVWDKYTSRVVREVIHRKVGDLFNLKFKEVDTEWERALFRHGIDIGMQLAEAGKDPEVIDEFEQRIWG